MKPSLFMAPKSGRVIVGRVYGKRIRCVTVGGLAAALGRSPRTIRLWERTGLLPKAPFLLRPDNPRAQRRLYPEQLVEVFAQVAKSEGFGRRRRSGLDDRHRDQLWAVYDDVMRSIQYDPQPSGTGSIPE